MKVLFVSAEAAPYAKAGGLADVVGALPLALQNLGIDARIMMPYYQQIDVLPRPELVLQSLEVPFAGQQELVRVFQTTAPNSRVRIYFIANESYLSRGPIYDEHGQENPFHDISRFLFFARACASVLPKLGWRPHIVHCHDWHTGLVPAFLDHEGAQDLRTIFTIHNLAHQGAWNDREVLSITGLDPAKNECLRRRDPHGDFNILQQGILGASTVTAVSPEYAKEVITPEFGFGLENTLREKPGGIVGILNGIDVERNNPETDAHIRVHYAISTLERKCENKLAIHEVCGFRPDGEAPTFGFIGRLTDQKGIDLIIANAERFVKAGARLVVLGTGIPKFENEIRALAARYPESIACRLEYDASFAQMMYAGADLMLMPSKFEPCGLVQMVAMRYGTPVVARATGGLKDTVSDVDSDPEHGLGFVFQDYQPEALWEAADRSLRCFTSKQRWTALVERCMSQDFSWRRSAQSYLRLYEQLQGGSP